jgi:transposase-like protein
MSDYDNTNSGALFKNNRKEQGSNQPDMTGVLNVEGKDYRVSAWSNESKAGTKYFSMKISEKQEVSAESKESTREADVPF